MHTKRRRRRLGRVTSKFGFIVVVVVAAFGEASTTWRYNRGSFIKAVHYCNNNNTMHQSNHERGAQKRCVFIHVVLMLLSVLHVVVDQCRHPAVTISPSFCKPRKGLALTNPLMEDVICKSAIPSDASNARGEPPTAETTTRQTQEMHGNVVFATIEEQISR